MKFDISKKGLLSVFRPYQIACLRFLMEVAEGVGSGTVWRHLTSLPDENVHMSRASVIFFLNDMVDDGICTWQDRTGKGGHHRIYDIVPKDEEALKRILAQTIQAFINEELLSNDITLNYQVNRSSMHL